MCRNMKLAIIDNLVIKVVIYVKLENVLFSVVKTRKEKENKQCFL